VISTTVDHVWGSLSNFIHNPQFFYLAKSGYYYFSAFVISADPPHNEDLQPFLFGQGPLVKNCYILLTLKTPRITIKEEFWQMLLPSESLLKYEICTV
jgi:hypothetical protein